MGNHFIRGIGALALVCGMASAAPVSITTTTLPNGKVGAAYSQTLATSGGKTPFTWSVDSGSLPAGLALDPAAGTIAGTPTAAGTSNFTVRVTDKDGTIDTQALRLVVDVAPLTVTTGPLPAGTVGAAYSQTLAANGGSGGYTWAVTTGSLPAGLSLSSAGAITGAPTAAGTTNFTVTVTDSGNRTATKALSIAVSVAALTVTTGSLPAGTVGAAYSQGLTANGGSGGYTWSVTTGSLPAGLSLSGAGAITGTPTAAGTTNFTVTVTDSGNRTASKVLSIAVSVATLTVTTSSLPNGAVGAAYSQSLAASGGSGGYTWAVTTGSLPAGLSLSGAGAITGTPTAAGTTNFTVTVTDSGNRTASKALTIAINAPALTVTTASLPNGAVGAAYSQTLASSGGAGGNAWSVTTGSLPAGLTLAASGAITGTPTAAGTSNFTVQVKDSSGAVASKALTLAVDGSPVTVTTQSLPAGEQGASYSQTLAASGGAGGYRWAVTDGSLPAGLSIDLTGRIFGIPTSTGTATFTAQATDTAGASGTKLLTIAVAAGPSFAGSNILAAGVVGTPYSSTARVTGGQLPYSFLVVAGQLPPGLSLNAATGEISGSPLQIGSFPFTLQVRDAAGSQIQAAFAITINNGLTVTTAPLLPTASISVSYSVALLAAGGAAPYTWSVSAGALPAGLTFHADGKIDGIPAAAGSFAFTATVTDSNGTRGSKDFTLVVAAGLTITTGPQLPAGVPGASYSATLAASGGTAPYTWSVSAGALPAGVKLDAATGTLAGTPSASGTFQFTATVTDSVNVTAQKAFSLTVAPGLSFATPASLPDAVAGTAYNFTLRASGGQAPYSWRIADGALPDGLSLNGSSGAIVGVPSAAGTFNFTVEVADAAGLKASRVHTIVTNLPSVPTLTIGGVPGSLDALQQPFIDVVLSASYPVAITGRLNLSFTPAGGMPDDPTVQFSSGGRSVAFTIPANTQHATFGGGQLALQSGSVAGTIQLSVDSLTAGSTALPGSPVQTAQVASSAAAIRKIGLTRTASGFEVQIVGLSTTRELAGATVRFHASTNATLQTTEVSVPLVEVAKAWFQSNGSTAFGGQFTLTLPFSIVGGTVALDSVSVVLMNGVGASAEVSTPY